MEKALRALGITRMYKGYRQLLFALTLGQKPAAAIYRETAKHFGCSWKSVEANIRTAAIKAWETNPELLSDLAGCSMESPPTAARLMVILTNSLAETTGSDDDFG